MNNNKLRYCPKEVTEHISKDNIILVNYFINKYFNETKITIEDFWGEVAKQKLYKRSSFISEENVLSQIANFWIAWHMSVKPFSLLFHLMSAKLEKVRNSKEFKEVVLSLSVYRLLLPKRLSKIYKQLGYSHEKL